MKAVKQRNLATSRVLQFLCYWWTSSLIKCSSFLCTWFVQLQTNKFQGLFKDKLQFSRSNIYSINQRSFTPFWTPYWLKHVMESFFDFNFFSHGWSHYLILLYTTRLCKMTGYALQLHLRYRNSIWNKETDMKYSSSTKTFLRYPWVL